MPLITLTALWVLLWGNVSVANIVSGLVLAAGLTRLSRLPPTGGGARVSPWHCLRLFAWFVADMASSAANVAWQAVRPGPQPPNAVIAVTLRTRSDLTMTITALALCAVPGSLITEVRRSTATLYIHVLGVRAESELERVRRGVLALERRVIRALGNAEDRRLLAEEGPAP
ncbi:Na+/H+ antiporter subunit E [Thermocatellispora tengchongensis]